MINKFKPKYIHAYPSAIFLLCKLLQKEKIKCGVKIKAIFTDSEVLYEYQKKKLKNFFNVEFLILMVIQRAQSLV